MVRNKELVFKMSAEQKIRFITSAVFGENRNVDNYGFPVFGMSKNPVARAEGAIATVFPSDKALASTWNMPVVSGVYKCIANEAKADVGFAYFNVSNNLSDENISEDYFLLGKYLTEKVRGINGAGGFVNFENIPADCSESVLKELVPKITDGILADSHPNSVTCSSCADAENLTKIYDYSGLLYGVAASKEEVARLLYLGCSLVFMSEDFTEELVPYITELTERFKEDEQKFKDKKMSLADFDGRIRRCEILDASVIDSACDRIVDLLLGLRDCNPSAVGEKAVSLEKGRAAKFNESLHDKLALSTVHQSAVLLKNRNNILPLSRGKKVAVIGEYVSNIAYQRKLSSCKPTAERLVFDCINDYEINAVGYAHGYLMGQRGRKDLTDTALELCKQSEVALVYLCAERGATKLPAEQTELLNALFENGVKVIAVISCDGLIDMAFTVFCEAAVLTYRGGQAETCGVLDILTGAVCPSGKLAETIPLALPENTAYGELPAYGNLDKAKVLYAFGHGLSYTSFDFSHLSINENGISLTVMNTGGCDGYATVQMYVRKEDSPSTLSHRQLAGFAKVFIKKNDAVKVEIPFDGGTFKSYDAVNRRHIVEGGKYEILVGDSSDNIMIKGELTLDDYIFGGAVHKNTELEMNDRFPAGFTADKADAAIRREKKGLSFGLKLFLAIALALYYDGVCGVLAFSNLITDKQLLFYIVIGAIFALGNVFFLIYLVKICKRRRLQKYLHPTEVLTDLVGKVKNFNEVAKVSYVEPVICETGFEEQPEQSEESVPEAEPVVEEQQAAYDTSFGGGEEKDTRFAEHTSFADICSNFRDYSKSRGILIEPSSVRSLFAAVAASKIVILDCRNPEALPDFTKILNDYFGNAAVTAVSGGWKSPDNLLWEEREDMYVTSGFANTVNAAVNNREKNCAAILTGAKSENLRSYFKNFIDYALYPSEEHTLVLSDELSLRLPDNITYILVPDEDDFADKLTPDVIHASTLVEIIISKTESEQTQPEIKYVSRNTLGEMITYARENCFLAEKMWKKIDELVEAVSASGRFRIGNKEVMQLEKLTSVVIDCGGDESEALICAFTAKIVPLLKTSQAYKNENGARTVYGIIEKLFEEEDISKIKKALLKRNED